MGPHLLFWSAIHDAEMRSNGGDGLLMAAMMRRWWPIATSGSETPCNINEKFLRACDPFAAENPHACYPCVGEYPRSLLGHWTAADVGIVRAGALSLSCGPHPPMMNHTKSVGGSWEKIYRGALVSEDLQISGSGRHRLQQRWCNGPMGKQHEQ
jgi:hypothetical protein